jgi:hypothetical protein
VRSVSHRFFVPEKPASPQFGLSLAHAVFLHFGKNLTRISRSVKCAKTRMDQHGHVFGGKWAGRVESALQSEGKGASAEPPSWGPSKQRRPRRTAGQASANNNEAG